MPAFGSEVLADIRVKGKGTIRFASSSAAQALDGTPYIVSQSNDWRRTACGVYNNSYDFKFFMNGELVKIIILPTNDATITSSSVENSFTVVSGANTASLEIIFRPEKPGNDIVVKKVGVGTYNLTNSENSKYVNIDYFMSNPTQLGLAQSGMNLPTAADYNRGYMFRYLYRQANNDSDFVKEVSEAQYSSVSSFYLYKAIKIKWKIVGNKEKTQSTNTNIANQADAELKGSKSLLMRNPLLHWKDLPDVVETFDVTAKVVQSGV